MPNGEFLDKVGCEFGRTTRNMFNEHKQDYLSITASFREQFRSLEYKVHNLEKGACMIEERMTKLETKLAWLMGVSAMVGSVIGTLIVAFIKHLI